MHLEMNRDTDELPSIISDIEDDVTCIKSDQYVVYTFITVSHTEMLSEQLQAAKAKALVRLETLSEILSHLEKLESHMMDMLDRQVAVEVRVAF